MMDEKDLENFRNETNQRVQIAIKMLQDLLVAMQNERVAYMQLIEQLKKEVETLKNPKVAQIKEELRKKGVKVE